MFPFLKDIFLHEAVFVQYARAALLGLGGAQVAGILPDTFPKWLGAVALVAGGFLKAGDKNPPAEGGK